MPQSLQVPRLASQYQLGPPFKNSNNYNKTMYILMFVLAYRQRPSLKPITTTSSNGRYSLGIESATRNCYVKCFCSLAGVTGNRNWRENKTFCAVVLFY